MKNFLKLSALVIISMLFIISCDETTLPVDDDSTNYPGAFLTHNGFDFSVGKTNDLWEENDGETISWYPGDGEHPDYPRDEYIWWRSSGTTKIKDYGVVDMSTVLTVPSSWDAVMNPLLDGHVYVVQCQDGYAKFKVVYYDINSDQWNVKVNYYYTSSTSFDK